MYASFDNCQIISKESRRIYRDQDNLKKLFSDPFDTGVPNNGFYGWWIKNKLKYDIDNNRIYKLGFFTWLKEQEGFTKKYDLVKNIFKKDGFYGLFKKILSKLKKK